MRCSLSLIYSVAQLSLSGSVPKLDVPGLFHIVVFYSPLSSLFLSVSLSIFTTLILHYLTEEKSCLRSFPTKQSKGAQLVSKPSITYVKLL